MKFTEKHSSNGKLFTFEIPENFEYTDLKGLAEKNGLETVYQVNALYINTKGKYGDSPVIATNCELVNAPSHLTSVVKDVLKDGESLSLINNGKVGFNIYTYENQHGVCYGLNWLDL